MGSLPQHVRRVGSCPSIQVLPARQEDLVVAAPAEPAASLRGPLGRGAAVGGAMGIREQHRLLQMGYLGAMGTFG